MLNKIELIGRLTKDPERRGNDPEKPIAHFRIAVDRDYKRDGEPTADYFDVSAFGKQANTILQHFRKGRLVCVVGALNFREWEDQQTGDKRTAVEVRLSEFHFLEKKEKEAAETTPVPATHQSAPLPPAPVAAPGYAAGPQPMPPQYAPAMQPAVTAVAAAAPPNVPVHYGEPDFSGVPESYGFGPGGAPLQNTPF